MLKNDLYYSLFLLSILLFVSLNILFYDQMVEGEKRSHHEDEKNNDDDVRENEKDNDDKFDDTSLDKLFGNKHKQDKDKKESNDDVNQRDNEKEEDENGDSDNHQNDDIPFILPFNPVPFP